MVDDDQQAITLQPVGKGHPAGRHGPDLGAGGARDQPAVAAAAVGQLAAEGRQHRSSQRPAQLAAAAGEGPGVVHLAGDVGDGIAQLFKQLEHGLFVAAQSGQARGPVLEARFEVGQHLGAVGALGFQGRQVFLLLAQRRGQHVALVLDALGDRGQGLQFLQQAGDALLAVGLEIAVVGQHAGQVGHAVLGQQQLELFVAAQGVGRTHQGGQGFTLFGQAGFKPGLFKLQVAQFDFGGGDAGFGAAQGAHGVADLGVGLTQGLAGFAAFAFEIALLGGDRLDLLAQLLQLLFGGGFLLFAVGRLGGGGHGRRGQAGGQHQATDQTSSTSGWPLISAGLARPSRESMVGAMSRRAPPSRRRALRPQ